MWELVNLGEVCELKYGKALEKEYRLESGDIPAYGANGVKVFSTKALYSKPSIIIGRKGSAGELNKISEPFWALDVAYYVIANEKKIDLDFLFYTLSSLNLPSLAKGVKPGINRNEVYEQKISLPPLSEQQLIVAKLDAAFGEINTEIKLAEEKEVEFIKLKAHFLRLLFSGEPLMLKKANLGDVCEFRQGLQVGKNLQKDEVEKESDVRFLRIIDFTQSNESPRYVDFPDEKYLVNKNDISLVRYGNPGFVCRGLEGVIANNLFRVIPKTSEIDIDFLYWFLISPVFQEKIGVAKKGVAMQAISFGTIKNIEIPIPPIEEQQFIVAKLEAIYREFENLNEVMTKNNENYFALKSVILSNVLQSEAA